MRIGLVTGEYPPMQGGVGAYTHILAQQFDAMGHEVAIFTSQGAYHDLPGVSLTTQIKHWNIPALFAIRRWANEQHLDLINLQFETACYKMSPWVHFLPDISSVPVVTTFHDLLFPYLFPKAGKLRTWIVNRLAHASAGAIVTNQEDKQNLPSHTHTTLIPIGSNIPAELPRGFQREDWRKKVTSDSDTFLIAYFGFMNHTKGVDTLLHALKILCGEHRNVHLIIIGGRTGASDPTNAAYAETIDTLINQHHLPVTWTGFVEDKEVAAYLHAADVVCLPFTDGASYRRGTLMAAIQQGCAIITTEPTIEIPLFQNSSNMLLVPPGNSEALVTTLIDVMDQPQQLVRLHEGALKLREHFQWKNIANDCINLFQRVLETSA